MTSWGSVFQMFTALFGMVTAVGGLVLTFKVMVPNFKVNKETHTIVNQQRTNMEQFQAVLINELTKHGIDIPKDQSKISTDTEHPHG